MTIQKLGQVALSTGDLEASIAFYRDVLGVPILFTAPPSLAFFMIGETRLMLSGGEEPQPNSAIYLQVPNVDDAWAELDGRRERHTAPHLVAKLPDHELWMAFVQAPEGTLVGLMEERR